MWAATDVCHNKEIKRVSSRGKISAACDGGYVQVLRTNSCVPDVSTFILRCLLFHEKTCKKQTEMLAVSECKEVFNLYDEEGDGKIDAINIGDVVRGLGLKPTNAMIHKAAGQQYKRKGEKRISFEEFMPIYQALSKEKEVGTTNDYIEGLRVFDKESVGKIMGHELRHVLAAVGERLTHEQVDDIMEGVEDSEGLVNYEAFIKKILAGPFPEEETE